MRVVANAIGRYEASTQADLHRENDAFPIVKHRVVVYTETKVRASTVLYPLYDLSMYEYVVTPHKHVWIKVIRYDFRERRL